RRLLYTIPPGESFPIITIKTGSQEPFRIIGQGGQTVMPPSRHPSGGIYRWTEGTTQLEPCTEWLRHYSLSKAKSTSSNITPLPGQTISQGQRNQPLASIAGAMRRQGCTEEEIYVALQVANERCQPPLDDQELRTIAHSIASRYEPFLPTPPPTSTNGHAK